MIALLGAPAAPARDASDVGTVVGPRMEPVARDAYAALFHVSEEGGSDESGDGSPERPWRTLSHALRTIGEVPGTSRRAVLVAEGDYAGETLEMRPRVDLYGGGVFVALWSSVRIADNVFVDNHGTDDGGALFVGGQEHRYDRPLDPVPPESEFHVEIEDNVLIGNSNPARNSGAMRFTMEARGRFADNVVAHNEGLYVQRSRLDVVRSTILDDLLVVESDRDARAVRFDDSILWGAVRLEGPAAIEGSLQRDGAGSGALPFESDWLEVRVLGAAFDSPRHRTRLLTDPLPVEAAALAGRVVRAAGRWGVVAAADADGIEVWGDVAEAVSLVVLPSYRPLAGIAAEWQPVRANKCIELLERDQPIYYQSAYGGYEEGRRLAGTWADFISYNMEHSPLSFDVLRQFMRGLVEGGPTPSGHRTPTVIVVLPLLGLDADGVLAGAWMVQQALAQGVHGVHLVRARDPKAVEAFVRAARYPIHEQATDVLGEGLRGWGSHKFAAWVWGVGEEEYLERADVWPLNPAGELMLGIKIEDRHALENTERSVAVPGIAFAEHGPRDMGFSYGHLEGRADPPLPPEVWAAGDRVLAACRRHGVAFLDNVLADNVVVQIERGVRIGAGSQQDAAERGRRHTGREMPW